MARSSQVRVLGCFAFVVISGAAFVGWFEHVLDQLRTSVRTYLPTVTPTDMAVVGRMLTDDIDLLGQIRQEFVYSQSPHFVRVVLDRVPLDPFRGRAW